MTTLKDRLEFLIKQRGSLRAFADSVGLNPSYISRLMAGKQTNPSDEVLRRIGLVKIVNYELIYPEREKSK